MFFDNNMLKEIKNNLKELGFNNNESAVYVALTKLGEATASQVAKKADLPRTTAISLLNKLREKNYFSCHIHKGRTYYWIESPKTIGSALEHKLEIAGNLDKLLTNLYRSEAHFPSVQTYDSRSGIRNFIEKFLANLEKKSVLYTIDSPLAKNYTKVYFEKIANIVLGQKRKREILTHSLIPQGSFKSIEEYKLRGQAIKIREMPEEIKFEASLWITKDTVVHFSGNPLFIVSIKHEAVYKSVKSLYDFLWGISAPKN